MGYFTWNLELVSKYLVNDCRSTIRSANHYTMFTMYFHPKTDSEHHHWILHIRISPSIKFHFKLVILIFGNKLSQKEYFGRKEKKSEHHHWILHIRISLGIKFQLKLTIVSFENKFAQKGCFRSKIEKVNTTIEFCIFELV